MSDDEWHNPEIQCIGLRLAGDAIKEVDDRGHRIVDDTLFILLSAHAEPALFVLWAHRPKLRWELLLGCILLLSPRVRVGWPRFTGTAMSTAVAEAVHISA